MIEGFSFLRVLQVKKRADERTRTADLISLRVSLEAFLGIARTCKTSLDKPDYFPSVCPTIARDCAVGDVGVM